MISLKQTELRQELALIDGEFRESVNYTRFEVLNPFDGALLARVTDCGAAEATIAVEAAHKAFQQWKKTTGAHRALLLRNWFNLIVEHKEELATLLTLEQGKPLAEARAEITYGASFVEWFAEEAKRIYGDVIPAADPGKRILVLKQPVGVVSAITPWNFPNAMITRKVAPALAAGCTVVVKPASKTPLSALALGVLAKKAGIPDGVINIVPGTNAKALGEVLTTHPLIGKISFTGSTGVGKKLLELGAHSVKKTTMELGGNAPFIVFEDADLDGAVDGLIASKFRNAGQTCIATNRIFVQRGVLPQFINKLQGVVEGLKVGDGMKDGNHIGPMISQQAIVFTEELIADAVKKGGEVITGGNRIGYQGFEPTLIANASREMEVFHQEIFGPVAAIFSFDTENEVVELANETTYGLASYFYGRDHGRIWRVAEALHFGMVGINTGSISAAEAPFGGVKQSGIGREGSRYGIDDYLDIKYLNWSVEE